MLRRAAQASATIAPAFFASIRGGALRFAKESPEGVYLTYTTEEDDEQGARRPARRSSRQGVFASIRGCGAKRKARRHEGVGSSPSTE